MGNEDVIHRGIFCDLCGYTIVGDRNKCLDCPDFDTCRLCYEYAFSKVPLEHRGHRFIKVYYPEDIKLPQARAIPVVHAATCSACNDKISGIRYKCMHAACADFDLCADCEALPIPVHPKTHPMLKVKTPGTVNDRLLRKKVAPAEMRSVRFWRTDGDVILRIENTHFKLSRTQLEAQSEVLKTKFENQRDSLVDLLPVYDIQGVARKDFEDLLSAFDDAITYAFAPPPFSTLMDILRASHTLSFLKFGTWAVKALETTFSSDIATLGRQRLSMQEAAETVAVAQTCELPAGIVKRAFYELLRGSWFVLQDQPEEGLFSPDTLHRLESTRERFTEAWLSIVCSLPTTSCPLGQDPPTAMATASCSSYEIRAVAWSCYMRDSAKPYLYDPILGLDELVKTNWANVKGFKACESCVRAMRDAWRKERKEVWARLDEWLDL